MKAKSIHSGYDACAIRASSSRSLSCEAYAGLAEEHNIPDFLHILSNRKLVKDSIRYYLQASPAGYFFCL